jgi:hypothetical protein
VPALCALIHLPEDVAEAACNVGGDAVVDNVMCNADAPKSAPAMMMRVRTGWCDHPMMTLGQAWQKNWGLEQRIWAEWDISQIECLPCLTRERDIRQPI